MRIALADEIYGYCKALFKGVAGKALGIYYVAELILGVAFGGRWDSVV